MLADRGRRISLADVAKLAVKMGWDYVIVDGTHVPAVTFGRKTAGQKAYYSGKHKRHGLNVQTVCSPDGELLWAAAPCPGATLDITAAREAKIAEMLVSVIGVLADLGYLGWDEAVITGRRKPRGKEMSPAQRAANRLQAQLRCVGERGNARLKYWKILATELRCRAGTLHRHGQGRPGPALPGARPVRRPARRVTPPDRTHPGPARRRHGLSEGRAENTSGQRKEPGRSCQTAAYPAGTQDEGSSLGHGLRPVVRCLHSISTVSASGLHIGVPRCRRGRPVSREGPEPSNRGPGRGVRRQTVLRASFPRCSVRPGKPCEVRATWRVRVACSTARRDSPNPGVTRRRWARPRSERAASGCMNSTARWPGPW